MSTDWDMSHIHIRNSPVVDEKLYMSQQFVFAAQKADSIQGYNKKFMPYDMSCIEQCQPCSPCCQPCGPTPLANSCSERCVRQCQSSTVVIELPAVLVTLPGPILSSFPQNTVVGSSTAGSILNCDRVPITSRGFDLSCIISC
ncbi:Feather keratin Cos1-1/Cos1-3/Cos2-1 [Willisornis vidua]|uniref:Keratin n=1 Tax=Willisornis vidua TaxID=1566151 RepID=A0ABQ9DVD6_9PASS|nr:Feather keratin Cos1-1/Cos1-3/Cos2-1 [Willisornis vidua]